MPFLGIRLRTITLLGSLGLAALAFGASAADDPAARCLEAAAKDDAKKVVAECSRAVDADPSNERARQELDRARAELARAASDHPAKLKQR